MTPSRPNGQLVRLDGTQQKVIYGCTHNVASRVEDYVVVVPEGQEDGDRGLEVRTTLLALTQKMFAYTPTDQ